MHLPQWRPNVAASLCCHCLGINMHTLGRIWFCGSNAWLASLAVGALASMATDYRRERVPQLPRHQYAHFRQNMVVMLGWLPMQWVHLPQWRPTIAGSVCRNCLGINMHTLGRIWFCGSNAWLASLAVGALASMATDYRRERVPQLPRHQLLTLGRI